MLSRLFLIPLKLLSVRIRRLALLTPVGEVQPDEVALSRPGAAVILARGAPKFLNRDLTVHRERRQGLPPGRREGHRGRILAGQAGPHLRRNAQAPL